MSTDLIRIHIVLHTDLQKAWECWTKPEHITKWNFANEDWCCPKATNELYPGGAFSWRMETKDGSMGFDFDGVHEHFEEGERIESRLSDGRLWKVEFKAKGDQTEIHETFEADQENPIDLQQKGWQAILGNYKAYVESLTNS